MLMGLHTLGSRGLGRIVDQDAPDIQRGDLVRSPSNPGLLYDTATGTYVNDPSVTSTPISSRDLGAARTVVQQELHPTQEIVCTSIPFKRIVAETSGSTGSYEICHTPDMAYYAQGVGNRYVLIPMPPEYADDIRNAGIGSRSLQGEIVPISSVPAGSFTNPGQALQHQLDLMGAGDKGETSAMTAQMRSSANAAAQSSTSSTSSASSPGVMSTLSNALNSILGSTASKSGITPTGTDAGSASSSWLIPGLIAGAAALYFLWGRNK